MNNESLNDQLAKMCGYEKSGSYWMKEGKYVYQCEDRGVDPLTVWNPMGYDPLSLNQLAECYEALSEEEKEVFAFENRFAPVDLVFTNPQSLGKKILKAKGIK